MARDERSAGFILFRMAADRVPRRLYLLLDYGHHWDLAKGHVEAGEDDLTAARRELREETGIADAQLVEGFVHEIKYSFRSKRKGLVHKTVVFFLACTCAEQVILSEEHVGWAFLPYDAAVSQLTYPSAKQVLQAAEAHLGALGAADRSS